MELNLVSFNTHFPTDDACLQFLTQQRWPSGKVCCAYCGSLKTYTFKNRPIYQCGEKECRKQFSARTNTPFERSRIGLRKWFLGLYLLTSLRRGLPSTQLSRELGITQPTAWRMLHALREVMGTDFQLFGAVEVDEAYLHANTFKRSSARRKYGYTGRRAGEVVFGMLERGGRVKMLHVKSSGARVLHPLIQKYIVRGSRIYSDEHGTYKALTRMGYDHMTTTHSLGEYVGSDGNNTQSIENSWATFKRTIKGTYYWMSKKYLQKYCDEIAFRYNTRNMEAGERFEEWFNYLNLPVVNRTYLSRQNVG